MKSSEDWGKQLIFKFRHEGRIYEFDDDVLSIPEAQWLERETGYVGEELFLAFRKLGVNAVLGVFCLALKRGGMVIDKLDDVPLDPKNGYIQLINSIQHDDEAPQPQPARQPTRTVRKKAVAKG